MLATLRSCPVKKGSFPTEARSAEIKNCLRWMMLTSAIRFSCLPSRQSFGQYMIDLTINHRQRVKLFEPCRNVWYKSDKETQTRSVRWYLVFVTWLKVFMKLNIKFCTVENSFSNYQLKTHSHKRNKKQ